MGLFNLFGKKKDYAPTEVYLELRKQVLSLEAGQVDSLLEPSVSLLGMLMETGYDTAVVTLATIADGTVSLYFSNGGGMQYSRRQRSNPVDGRRSQWAYRHPEAVTGKRCQDQSKGFFRIYRTDVCLQFGNI